MGEYDSGILVAAGKKMDRPPRLFEEDSNGMMIYVFGGLPQYGQNEVHENDSDQDKENIEKAFPAFIFSR